MGELRFESVRALTDLHVFFRRLAHIGFPETLLVARPKPAGGAVLAVYGCTSAATSLLDATPTVLVMRAASLTRAIELDRIVEIRALTDRLARLDATATALPVPPTTTTAVWAGVQPPVTGWQRVATVDPESMRRVARDGSARVTAALPEQPGAAVVDRVRARVWGQEIFPGVPAAAALAGETLGFFDDAERELRLLRAPGWQRLSAARGDVLIRRGLG